MAPPRRSTRVARFCGVHVFAAFGQLAQPDRREVGPGFGGAGDGVHVAADLLFGRDRRMRRFGDRGADGGEHVAQDLAIERRLAVEVVVDHRLVQPGGAGDAIHVGAGVAAGGENLSSGAQDHLDGLARTRLSRLFARAQGFGTARHGHRFKSE